jgi:YD repeat-containing protein
VSGDEAGDPATTYSYSLFAPTRTDASGTYNFTLDQYGRQNSLTDPLHGDPNIYRWSYTASGAVNTTIDPTGNTTTDAYDPIGRLVSRSTTGASGCTNCAAYAFAYNRAGNLLGRTSTIATDATSGTTTFGYDGLSRLTAYTPPAALVSGAYTWNAQPDRASVQAGSGTPVTTLFNNASRPVSDTASGTYGSDNQGRLTAMPGKTLVFDILGRLTQVKAAPSGDVLASYTYDALDRLRTITESGVTTRLRYVGLSNAIAQVVADFTRFRHLISLEFAT